jgi:tetratricopeptide (TPR) repeat protein
MKRAAPLISGPAKWRQSLIPVLLALMIAAAGAAVYSNSLENPFVFDDHDNIVDNPHIRFTEVSWEHIAGVLKSPSGNRPLANLTFALNYYFHGYDVTGYHLVNLFIHIAAGILLFFFLRLTLRIHTQYAAGREWGRGFYWLLPFLAALAWAVHPLHIESVTYVVQRMTSLAAMFFISSCLLYALARLRQLRDQRGGMTGLLFAGALISGLCALASKENAATLPVFILLYEWFFFQDLKPVWSNKRLLAVVACIGVLAVAAFIFLGKNPVAELLSRYGRYDFDLPQRLMSEFRVIAYYVSLWVYPDAARLTLDYGYPVSYTPIAPFTTMAAFLAIVALFVFVLYSARKKRLLSFCILWFLGNLIVESSIIPLALIFEHRTYLPSMLLAFAGVVMLFRYVNTRILAISFLCGIIALFSVWTYQRNSVWQDRELLWADCVKKSPASSRAHFNLGYAYFENGKLDRAVPEFRRALEISPRFARGHNFLGIALYRKGQYSEAKAHHLKALEIEPENPIAHANLGNVLKRENRLSAAKRHYRKAIELDPYESYAHYNLGLTLYHEGRIGDAVKRFHKTLELAPNSTKALNMLGVIYFKRGRYQEARNYYRRALQINQTDAAAHINLGNALRGLGEMDAAKTHYLRAIDLDPGNADAFYNLGVAVHEAGDAEKAADYFRKALELDPDHERARKDLAQLEKPAGGGETAAGKIQPMLEENPGDADAHLEMANHYKQRGQPAAAKRHYQKVLDADPDNIEAHNNLAKLLIRQNRIEAAETHLARVLEIDSSQVEALINFGIVNAMQDRPEAARSNYQEALSIDPDNADAHTNLAILLSRQKEPDAAIKHFRKALELNPNDRLARRYLNRLLETR